MTGTMNDDEDVKQPDFKKIKLSTNENNDIAIDEATNTGICTSSISSYSEHAVDEIIAKLVQQQTDGNSISSHSENEPGSICEDDNTEKIKAAPVSENDNTEKIKMAPELITKVVANGWSNTNQNHHDEVSDGNELSSDVVDIIGATDNKTSVEVRKEKLRQIATDRMSFTSTVRVAQQVSNVESTVSEISTEDIDISQHSQSVASISADVVNSSESIGGNDGTVIVKRRRAPRKVPKPRMPLENRVYISKKELDSAASFLEDKEDLCDCLPLEDCFLLGRRFWIFTVKQLELALNEEANIFRKISVDNEIDQLSSTILEQTDQTQPEDPSVVKSQVETQVGIECFDETEAEALSSGDLTSSSRNPEVTTNSQGIKSTTNDKSVNDESFHPDGESNIQESRDSPSSSHQMVVNLDRESLTSEKLSMWRKAIASFRAGEKRKSELKYRFSFDGPIKLLFPQATLNFFQSIQLKTLWHFLGLRKSETGAVCELMHIWRRECNLSTIPDIGLGRHFISLASRIESVLKAYPPIPEADRGWILDPISGITGAARDFLIRYQKIFSGEEFLNMKTKQLADVLETWRHENGMEKLRGSGKVAMISAWKACVKEALEAEHDHGRVIDLTSFVLKVQNEKSSTHSMILGVERNKMIDEVVTVSSSVEQDVALHSKVSLERVLGEGAAALLRSGGVRTASELFSVDVNPITSQLYKTLIDTGIVSGELAFNKAVENWRLAMRNYLNKDPNGEQHAKDMIKVSPGEIDGGHDSAKISIPSTQLDSVVSHRLPTIAVASKPEVTSFCYRPRKPPSSSYADEAFDVLSDTTKEFLASMGIHNAYQFLTTRSSILAANFVPWRLSKGKPALKGMGSIASISGWKAQVRKRAKELGLNQLAEAEPATKGSKQNLPERAQNHHGLDDTDKVDEASLAPNVVNMRLDSNKVLFAVEHRDISCKSVFEISLRKSDMEMEDRQFFITYKGATFHRTIQNYDNRMLVTMSSNQIEGGDRISERQVRILSDVPVHSQMDNRPSEIMTTFSSILSSGGLIDVSRHGAVPYKDQALEKLQFTMEHFVERGSTETFEESCDKSATGYNILLRKTQLDKFQYLLYVASPLERGQTLKLIFPSIREILCRKSQLTSDYSMMHKIDECLRILTVEDLRKLMEWNSKNVHAIPTDSIERLIEVCVCRRRQYWLGRRIFASIGSHHHAGDDKLLKSMIFTEQNYTKSMVWNNSSIHQKAQLSTAFITQIIEEWKYTLDWDTNCGSDIRRGWSSEAIDFFEKVLRCSAQSISASHSTNYDWSALLEVVKSTSSLQKSSKVDAGTVDTMDVDRDVSSPGQASKDEEFNSPTLSYQFIWQTINAVFEAARLDLFETEISNCLKQGLSAVDFVLFHRNTIVHNPISISYQHELIYDESTSRVQTNNVPHTLTLFLGLVWPEVRRLGWRMIAGTSPDEVTFVPKALSRKRLGTLKQVRDSHNIRLFRIFKVSEINLIPKAGKRLLLAVTNEIDGSNLPANSNVQDDKSYTVAEVLRKFQEWLHHRLDRFSDSLKATGNEIIGEIVIALTACFDSCACMLPPIADLDPIRNSYSDEHAQCPVEAYRCEYLIPFIVSLLSIRTVSDTSDSGNTLHGVALDLLYYITENCTDLFDKHFLPPPEEYVQPRNHILWIENHVKSLVQDDEITTSTYPTISVSEGPTEVSETSKRDTETNHPNPVPFEVLLDDEKDQVTDFIRIILENTKPFFASNADARRRNGRQLGRPGLACRHCFGKHGEGKYWFSSLESLATCYPVLEKHYLRCPDTPTNVRTQIMEARSVHPFQRKRKPHGSQQATFIKLWNRMEKCKPDMSSITAVTSSHSSVDDDGGDDNVHDDDDDDVHATTVEDTVEDEPIFTDHRAVIDYLNSDAIKLSKSSRQDIQEALQTYYSCIEYAGRIYGTSSMPRHFTTQWLLKKMTYSQRDYSNAVPGQYVG